MIINRLLAALRGPSDDNATTLYQQTIHDQSQALTEQAETLNTACNLLGQVKEQIQRVDTLRDVNIDGYVIEALRNLVNDHEELESRIEAVLVLPGHEYDPHQIDTDGGEMVLDRDEVHALLRGKKRVPDTPESLT